MATFAHLASRLFLSQHDSPGYVWARNRDKTLQVRSRLVTIDAPVPQKNVYAVSRPQQKIKVKNKHIK